MGKLINKREGITLIALVVTIVVLLILAGVSIAMLTGDNGIIIKAQRAKNETENTARKEEEDLAKIEAEMNGTGIPIVQVKDEKPGELEKEDDNTFIINSIEDLVFFSYDVTTNENTYEGKIVKLGTNLDFKSDKSYVDPDRTDFDKYGYTGSLKQALTSGTGFSPIGDLTSSTSQNLFYGIFDGNNKAICSLYIDIDTNQQVLAGLFSVSYGEIRNLGLVNANITVKGQQGEKEGGTLNVQLCKSREAVPPERETPPGQRGEHDALCRGEAGGGRHAAAGRGRQARRRLVPASGQKGGLTC